MVPKRPAKPGQARGKRTRENLIQVAIQSLCESHVHGLKFSQISKIAQVPQPLVDYHFPSMEALLGEMVAHQLERLKVISEEAITKHPKNPRKALTAYIRAPFDLGQNDQGFRAVWSCYYHLATVNKAFAEFNRGVRIHSDKRLAALLTSIASAENRGERTNRKRIRATATCIQGIMTGFAYIAAAESGGDFKGLGDLAVKAAQQIVDVNFPVNA